MDREKEFQKAINAGSLCVTYVEWIMGLPEGEREKEIDRIIHEFRKEKICKKFMETMLPGGKWVKI